MNPGDPRKINMVTYIGLVVNFVLMLLKILVGYFGHSHALIADGIHSLSDSVTDVLILVGAKLWSKPPDEDHPYGHRKLEAFATILIGVLLASVGLGLAYKAILRLHNPEAKVLTDAVKWTLLIAVISIVAKEILYHLTVMIGKQVRSSAVIANAWHHRSDALSSIPVAIAILISYFFPSWAFLDPIATIIVGFFLLQTAWKISSPSFNDLMEHAANPQTLKKIETIVRQIPSVRDVHKIRSRSISGVFYIDLHILVDKHLDIVSAHKISSKVKKALFDSDLDVVDVLVHIEPYLD